MLESCRVFSDIARSSDFHLPAELQLQEGLEKYMGVTSEKVRNCIHDDLAFSILSKLPLKSLKRFGCVRKSWALENPNFMSIFCNNFISNQHCYFDGTSLLLQRKTENSPSYCEWYESLVRLVWPNPFQQEQPQFSILDSGSITGILCLFQVWQPEKVVLWNPATDELMVIPPSPNESAPRGLKPFPVIHGFGYDQVNDDYKLIRFVMFFSSNESYYHPVPPKDPLWEIYSLRNNSWRTVDGDKPASITQCYSLGERLYIDGMCHWWGSDINATHEDEQAYYLSSFDLSSENFFTTPASIYVDDNLIFYLLALNGYISLISWYYLENTFHISILGELGVKESWTKLYTIGPLSGIEEIIGTWKNGIIFFRKDHDELVLFDLSTQQIKELGTKVKCGSYMLIYKENFLPIGGINH